MENIIKTTSIFAAAAAIFAGAALSVSAAGAYGSGAYGTSDCQMIYGGGEVCNTAVSYQLNKQVQTVKKGGEFVENLTINDHKFVAGETVNYKITVKNTGKDTVKDLRITDTLPGQLEFASAKNGKYNNDNRTVTFTVNSLDNGKSAEFIISTKVKNDVNASCPINNVTSIDSNGNAAEDTAMICIDHESIPTKGPTVQQTPPMKQTPSTGPEMLSLAALIPTGALGMYLKRKKINN